MSKPMDITVRNELKKEKRDIYIYHHSGKNSGLISYNNTFTCGIQPEGADDYLHISVSSGPGDLNEKCILDLPAFMDFQFLARGDVTLVHSGPRTRLTIPPGPPTWELLMTVPERITAGSTAAGKDIVIRDTEQGDHKL